MARYEHPEVCFDVPGEWTDRTVVAFAAPVKPGQATASNIVMTRDQLAPSETLRSYADKQLAELARRLDGFKLGYREERTVSGVDAVEIRFTWKGNSGPLDQRLLMLATGKRTVLSFTATAAQAEAGHLVSVFDRVFSSITLPSPG